ncbi:hypothetical protein AMTRI_Chr04g248390 [Amborella trichopoda]
MTSDANSEVGHATVSTCNGVPNTRVGRSNARKRWLKLQSWKLGVKPRNAVAKGHDYPSNGDSDANGMRSNFRKMVAQVTSLQPNVRRWLKVSCDSFLHM